MKFPIILLLGLLSNFPLMAQPDSHLAAYRWEQRLVLVFAPDDSHPQFSQQMQEVQRETAEWQDRDLGVFQLWPKGGLTPEQEALNREQSQRLYRQYGVVPGEFVVILIGKDGGEKARRKDEILSNETLFPIIDAMPMRRSEMRRNPKRN